MSEQATILNYAVLIEKKLEDLGAVGAGIHKKLSSIEEQIDAKHTRLIRKIASVRNKAAHVYNYQYGNIKEFKHEADTVISYLDYLGDKVNVRYNHSKKCDYPEDKSIYNPPKAVKNNAELFFQTLLKFISKIAAIVFIASTTYVGYMSQGIVGAIFAIIISMFISSIFIKFASQISLPIILFLGTFFVTYSYWGEKFIPSENSSIKNIQKPTKVKSVLKTKKRIKKIRKTTKHKRQEIDEDTRKLIEEVLSGAYDINK